MNLQSSSLGPGFPDLPDYEDDGLDDPCEKETRSKLALHSRDERVQQVIKGLRVALDARFADNGSVLEYVLATHPHLKQRLRAALEGGDR